MVPRIVAIGASNTAGLYGEFAADVVNTQITRKQLTIEMPDQRTMAFQPR